MKTSRGFSLVEVLIAMLVVAIGILGVAGLQVVSLQQNRNAILRDQALQAGNDILDRMRANPTVSYAPVTLAQTPTVVRDCYVNICSTSQMAAFDINQWKCRVDPFDGEGTIYPICATFNIQQASLPQGKSSITKVGDVYSVKVQWVKDRNGGTNEIILSTQTRLIN